MGLRDFKAGDYKNWWTSLSAVGSREQKKSYTPTGFRNSAQTLTDFQDLKGRNGKGKQLDLSHPKDFLTRKDFFKLE